MHWGNIWISIALHLRRFQRLLHAATLGARQGVRSGYGAVNGVSGWVPDENLGKTFFYADRLSGWAGGEVCVGEGGKKVCVHGVEGEFNFQDVAESAFLGFEDGAGVVSHEPDHLLREGSEWPVVSCGKRKSGDL